MASENNIMITNLPAELLINIFEYLSFSDIQCVRLVCKRWKSMADLPYFFSNVVLKITDLNFDQILCDPGIQKQLFGERKFQNVSLDTLDNDSVQKILKGCGTHVKNLILQNSPVFSIMKQFAGSYLLNLKVLTINNINDKLYYGQDDVEILDLNSLRNLDTIVLGGNNSRITNQCFLRAVASVMHPMEGIDVDFCYTQEDIVLQVLTKHASSWKKIKLKYFSSDSLSTLQWKEAFAKTKCLKILQLTGSFKYDLLMDIFQNENLINLRYLDLSGIAGLSDELMTHISQNCSSLHRLEVMFGTRITDRSAASFSTFSQLKVLNLSYCNSITTYGILSGVTSIDERNLRELYLNDLNLSEDCICACARSLPHLWIFSVSGCSNAVTDYAVEHIFHYQIHLRTLDLDYCFKLTDNGLLGTATGYSIIRLRGLQSLSIRGCRNLTNKTLILGLHFTELRSLNISYCKNIASAGIKALIINCSTIETLTLSSCPLIDDECVRTIAIGLKRLRKLNVSNCTALTEKSIKYITDFCILLQELSVCGVFKIDVCDFQKQLLRLKEIHF